MGAYSGDDYLNNDTLALFSFYPSPQISSFPYLQDFESNNGHWYTGGVNSSWQYGTPGNAVITRAANGNRAWVTGLTTGYNNSEYSYLYSPCFQPQWHDATCSFIQPYSQNGRKLRL